MNDLFSRFRSRIVGDDEELLFLVFEVESTGLQRVVVFASHGHVDAATTKGAEAVDTETVREGEGSRVRCRRASANLQAEVHPPPSTGGVDPELRELRLEPFCFSRVVFDSWRAATSS